MTDRPLSGQVVLLSGASIGIGRALAGALADDGASVAGMARGAERLGETMKEVSRASGSSTLALPTDVTRAGDVAAAVERAVEAFGRVDLLINCAGLVDAAEVPLWEADEEQWWDVVASHVRGAQLLVRSVVPHMLRQGSGRLINLASSMGTRAVPDYSAYSVAKAAQIRLTEAVAASLDGTSVRAFNIAPGLVDTDMTRSMPKWRGYEDWTPVDRVVGLVRAVATGTLDAWSGRLLRAGADSPESLRNVRPSASARRLVLQPYGDADPLG